MNPEDIPASKVRSYAYEHVWQRDQHWFSAHRIVKVMLNAGVIVIDYEDGDECYVNRQLRLNLARFERTGVLHRKTKTYFYPYDIAAKFGTQFRGQRAIWDEFVNKQRLVHGRWPLEPSLVALGLHQTASQDDVKRAYRERAKTLHPDVGGSHEAFINLQQQYESALDIVAPERKTR